MRNNIIAVLLLVILSSGGCTSYKSQYVSFRPPQAYQNYVALGDVSIGAEAYPTKKTAKEAFGFDIKGAGLLPVQVVLENNSGNTLELLSRQIFLVDNNNRYWPVVPTNAAIARLEQSTELSAFLGKGAGKGALLGATSGAVLGAAIGIVSGQNVGSALGKGAAIGGAGGAVIGGTSEGTSREREYRITDDIREKSLEGKAIPQKALANGFIFFPAEAESARELRIQYREKETGKVNTAVLKLQ